MTKDEKHEEIGRIVVTLSENKKTLVCLESKARRIAKMLEETAGALKTGSGRIPVKVYPDHPDEPEIDHEAHWITAQSINALIKEIEDTKKEIKTREKELSDLGM